MSAVAVVDAAMETPAVGEIVERPDEVNETGAHILLCTSLPDHADPMLELRLLFTRDDQIVAAVYKNIDTGVPLELQMGTRITTILVGYIAQPIAALRGRYTERLAAVLDAYERDVFDMRVPILRQQLQAYL